MDSALGHIAAAVATPCVTLFGPGKPGVWAPQGPRHRIVYSDLPCIHCGQTGCNGQGRSLCLEQLSVEAVETVILAQLGSGRFTGSTQESQGLVSSILETAHDC